jgi:DNA polymerase-1
MCLVDGSGFLFRAFFALPPLLTPEGNPIGAILGFINMILKVQEEHAPDYWALALDCGRSTHRTQLDPNYKANRSEIHPDLGAQFALMPELCKAMNLVLLQEKGVEADDLLATYTKAAKQAGHKVLVVSSDKDMMQLVGGPVEMFDPLKQKRWDERAVQEAWGVLPYQLSSLMALMGDASDNIQGIPGVGPKTALKWLTLCGSLESLLLNPSQLKNPTKEELVRRYAPQVLVCHDLVRLQEDLPLLYPLEALAYRPPDSEGMNAFVTRYHLDALKRRLIRKGIILESVAPVEVMHANAKITQEALEKEGKVSLVLHQTSEKKLGVSLAWGNHGAYVSWEDFLELVPILSNPAILKIMVDVKQVMHDFWNEGMAFTLFPFEDVSVLSYIVSGGGHALNTPEVMIERVLEKSWQDTAVEARARLLFQAYQTLRHALRDMHATTIYEVFDRPCITVLAEIERTGISLDVPALQALSSELSEKLKALEQLVFKASGTSFLLQSPKQLGNILFDTLKWPGGRRGKSGAYHTSSVILEAFALYEGDDEASIGRRELASILLQWRQLSKLRNTYTEVLPALVDPKTGKIFTTYTMHVTSTGRLSSIHPNLQNIPVRSVEGKKIRQAFHASSPNHVLLSLDYSNIELRLLAHMGNISPLKEMFCRKEDVHAQTASELFDVLLNDVTPELRRQAKILNFGVLYGIGAFGLAQQLSISLSQAKRAIAKMMDHYPGLVQYQEKCKENARREGFVMTLWGRRCYIPDIQSKKHALRAAAERQAINAPLQGTSADIIKRAMIHGAQWIQKTASPARIVLQVHDELILDVPKACLEETQQAFIALMESAVVLSVPLVVHAHASFSWQ